MVTLGGCGLNIIYCQPIRAECLFKYVGHVMLFLRKNHNETGSIGLMTRLKNHTHARTHARTSGPGTRPTQLIVSTTDNI